MLRAMGEDIPDFVSQLLGQIGDNMVNEMQNTCPVDTGYLRDHISVTKLTENELEITSEAPYSGFVEYGTVKMEAQPFFEPVINTFTATGADQFRKDALANIAQLVNRYSPL